MLDEPFAAIDAQTREVLQVELLRVCQARDVTALFVTHDIAEATFLSDRVAVFSPRPGRIVEEIDVPWKRPRSQEVRRTPEFAEMSDRIADVLYAAKSAAQTADRDQEAPSMSTQPDSPPPTPPPASRRHARPRAVLA